MHRTFGLTHYTVEMAWTKWQKMCARWYNKVEAFGNDEFNKVL